MKFFVIMFCALSSFSFAKYDAKKIEDLKKYIKKAKKEWNIPGVAVAIIQDGKVHELVFGEKEIGKEEKIDNHTIFSIASGTKPFLVHLTAYFVDRGLLKWDDPVRKYRPNFFVINEEISKKFTIRDLLSHRSGLKDFGADTLWDIGASREEIQSGLAKIPAEGTFRKTFAYQNHFFGTMALILEKLTGKTIETLFKEVIFEPLNMTASFSGYEGLESNWKNKLTEFFGQKKNIAMPHYTLFRRDGTNQNIISMSHDKFLFTNVGSSGINTSLSDLTKWTQYLMTNESRIISNKSYQEIFKEHVKMPLKEEDNQFPSSRISEVSYGLGIFMQNYGVEKKKIKLISHMGASGGWRSYYGFCPKENFGFVIMCNMGTIRINLFPEALRSRIMDMYLDIEPRDWSHELYTDMVKNRKKFIDEIEKENNQFPKPHTPLSLLCGKYQNNFYGDLEIQEKGNKLILKLREKEAPLEHFNADRFSFNSHLISAFWSGYDIGFLEFGEKDGIPVCYVNQLYETQDPLFKKVN